MEMRLSEVAQLVAGRHLGDDVTVRAAAIDSRRVESGDLFVALDGANVRGIEFADAAIENGAAAAMVPSEVSAGIPQVIVDNPLGALQALASFWRGEIDARVIAVTGSNGKTTMRSLIAACLGDNSFATVGNYNNHIGVPMMLTRLERTHRRAVLELGANHHGEIATMAAWVRPDIAIITNAGPAHLEGFGSIEGVAHAKGELFAALDVTGTAVINADDEYAPLWHELAVPAKTVTFGSGEHADCYFSDRCDEDRGQRFTLHTAKGVVPITLALDGEHNAMNATGAAAVALAAGIPLPKIAEGLSRVRAEPGRQDPLQAVNGATLFDDSYNANPGSMRAAAQMLATRFPVAWMAIGSMGELGDDSKSMHRDTGIAIREAGVQRLFTLGDDAAAAAEGFGDGAMAFDNAEALVAALRDGLTGDVALLVKGSRSMRMERIVQALKVEH